MRGYIIWAIGFTSNRSALPVHSSAPFPLAQPRCGWSGGQTRSMFRRWRSADFGSGSGPRLLLLDFILFSKSPPVLPDSQAAAPAAQRNIGAAEVNEPPYMLQLRTELEGSIKELQGVVQACVVDKTVNPRLWRVRWPQKKKKIDRLHNFVMGQATRKQGGLLVNIHAHVQESTVILTATAEAARRGSGAHDTLTDDKDFKNNAVASCGPRQQRQTDVEVAVLGLVQSTPPVNDQNSAWHARMILYRGSHTLSDDQAHCLKAIIQLADADDDDEVSELFDAISQPEHLDRMLAEKPQLLHTTGPTGSTILHLACQLNDFNVVHTLLRHGAKLEVRNHWRRTPLHIAVATGAFGCAQLLLGKRSDVNASDRWPYTPLFYVAWHSYAASVGLVKDLLAIHVLCVLGNRHPDGEAADNTRGGRVAVDGVPRYLGRTPLLNAVLRGNDTAASLLLEHGARADVIDKNGGNILYQAGDSPNLAVINALRTAHQKIDLDIRTTKSTQRADTPLSWFRWQLVCSPEEALPDWVRPGAVETAAFEALLREVRDTVLQREITKIEIVVAMLREGDLQEVREELRWLVERKVRDKIEWEGETFRAIDLDVRAGRIELAIESLDEYVPVARDRMKVSPFDEEKDPFVDTDEDSGSEGESDRSIVEIDSEDERSVGYEADDAGGIEGADHENCGDGDDDSDAGWRTADEE
ncbi:Uu.00g011900.m01.CDS01 [Anthostomella pinea]|uniref:Uu.00g011900.m01.CDS01 n=1 Tax=Anthostomella pinea TaxID=933095 RepID=A0AAI8YQ87_9PEZI|nr:Uu.00g011900.m01.CDS01 [Anthostomella pinea]